MANGIILIIDDEKNIRRSVEMICSSEGYQVATAANAEAAWPVLQEQRVDLILLDINLPGTDGLTLLSRLKTKHPDMPVIIISGYGTVENAVTATKRGAFDFIEKPIHKEKLLLAIKRALEHRRLEQENLALRERISGRYRMIGESAAMQKIMAQIEKVAPTDGRVLILGESGTGKELIARAIHDHSRRKHKAFVKVNCAAIPEELIESELFGSVKGAFTGATATRDGKFTQADGGTLFLDEVGDMSLKVQAKVLRALQEGEIEKVGGNKVERVDVRVIAATNKNLDEEVRAGRFREDLYFRLNVIPIVSPPLRTHKEDIPILINHFIEQYCEENGFRKISISDAALQNLVEYDWPGNVRELKNLIERLVIMSTGSEITTEDLPPHLFEPQNLLPRFLAEEGLSLKSLRERVEKEYIRQTLERCEWNISKAARLLDIDRTNLHKKINNYGLTPS